MSVPNLTNIAGRVPYMPDDTRNWAENFKTNSGLLKPTLMLRFASETAYIRNSIATDIYNDAPGKAVYTKAVMNVALPGMRVPGVLNWQVVEDLTQITSTASFEVLNCLPISETETTLTGSGLAQQFHSKALGATFVANSLFVVDKVSNGNDVINQADADGYYYREGNVKYRIFDQETFTVTDGSRFPDPSIPNDDDLDIPDSNGMFPNSSTGVGAYFIQIDNEVVKVIYKSGNTFYIPPGGRAVNGILENHGSGARVRLLGFGPYSGEWTGLGYLNLDDTKPQNALLRPGTCLTSYEGYGNLPANLTHAVDAGRNYQFTGYWFISGVEPTIGEDGVPKVKVDLKGPGQMFEGQKTSPDILRRIKNQFGQFRIGGETIWAAADHDRDIPGDWVDYDSWDPSLPGSYPLAIKVEFAQHKEFYDHMRDTEKGIKCEICRKEHAEWLKSHSGGGANKYLEDRAVGKHIYKQSIRVLQEEGGPIKTYIRLMSTIAAVAWDHPAYGTELAQRFSKIPNRLFDNIRNINTGLVYNGQLDMELVKPDPDFDWFTPTYDDVEILSKRSSLDCAFEATYDNQPFSDPMVDLAEINGCYFWVNREGYPVFKPRLFNARPAGFGFKDRAQTVNYPNERGEWFLSYGGSINGYQPSTNPESAISQCWVTAKTAFDTELTVLTGGTGTIGRKRVNYSALGGNREALALTSGVQQVETLSIDNMVLGMAWDTKAGWGVKLVDANGDVVVTAKPQLYDGGTRIGNGGGESLSSRIELIQKTINFFLVRAYCKPFNYKGQWVLKITVNGKWTGETVAGLNNLKGFLGLPTDGYYGRGTYDAINAYLIANEHFIKYDVFWYVANNKTWEEYVSSVTGVPIPVKNTSVKGKDGEADFEDYTPDQKLLNQKRENWTKTFSKTVINMANRKVDESLDQATVRSITTSIGDPRIQPGDVIWCEVPGFLGSRSPDGSNSPPFTNGLYVTQAQRQMDLQTGQYTGTFSGTRFKGDFQFGANTDSLNKGYDFL